MSLTFDPGTVSLRACHFIGGESVPAAEAMTIRAPSDGRALTGAPCADAAMVDRAVQSARQAWQASGWGRRRPRERLHALTAWAELIESDAENLARLEAICSSRPVGDVARGDVPVTAEQIRFFAEFADKEGGLLAPTAESSLGFVRTEPYGVVGAIAPWNFPISMAGWKIGPALAAGNAVVMKPSELTPFSTLRMAELAVEAGIPAGLLNVVLGDGPVTGTALVAHPGIDKISFTGSTRAGGAIMETVARTGLKPMTLELGGKSPNIVFADADLDHAVDCLARGILPNAGQFCVAGARMIVEAPVADELAARLAVRFAQPRPAATWQNPGGFSPIISTRHMARIDAIVQAAQARGAEILCGGGAFEAPGSYYRPTLLTGVGGDSPAVIEEIFGPVATFETFTTEDEALALAGHPDYGLCAGVHTRDLSRALRMVQGLQAGTVWVNRYNRSRDHILPTGGWKTSGLGKDLGREAYQANRRTKTVLIDL